LGIPTDTKSRFSMIRLDRETLDTVLTQYGFIGGGNTSNTSNTSKAVDNKGAFAFEVPFEDNITQKNLERTSNMVNDANTSSCNDFEVFEDISEGISKVAETKSLKEVRL